MELTHVSIGKKQKILITIFILTLALSSVLVVKRIYIDRDYLLMNEVDCDPTVEVCFKRLCDEGCDSTDGDYEFYKKQSVSASAVSVCDPTLEECPELVCAETEGCQEELCNEANVPENEECSYPEDFIQEESSSNSGDNTLDSGNAAEPQGGEEI